MARRDLVVIGGSAGAIEALTKLISSLPADFPAAMLVALHVSPTGTGALARILTRQGPLPASYPDSGAPITPGQVYIARGDRHLLVQDGRVLLSAGPKENSVRPAIDPLFRTAARWYGPRSVGVMLSGVLDDGVAGLSVIKAMGGVAVVQDPEDAVFRDMPDRALEVVDVDHVLSAEDIGKRLIELVEEEVEVRATPEGELPEDTDQEPDPLENITSPFEAGDGDVPSAFVCPDCGGTLWEVEEGEVLRFRCRVGHAYSPESLADGHAQRLEEALWAAVRSLEEHADLADRLAARMGTHGHERGRHRFAERAEELRARATVIREVLWGPAPAKSAEESGGA